MQTNPPEDAWLTPPVKLTLAPNQVDVWRVHLQATRESVESMASILSADESERAARFHFEADRNRFLLAHGCLRRILAGYLACEPRDIVFSVGKFGKPKLPNSMLEFNLSHAGEFALVATAGKHDVGIDVEHMRENMELESIARRNFSEREVEELMALPPAQRTRGFYHGWTRKEAYIKGQGLGLSLPLDSFDVSLRPGEPAVLRATRHEPEQASRWSLHSLDVAPAYAGALAVKKVAPGLSDLQEWDIRHWQSTT